MKLDLKFIGLAKEGIDLPLKSVITRDLNLGKSLLISGLSTASIVIYYPILKKKIKTYYYKSKANNSKFKDPTNKRFVTFKVFGNEDSGYYQEIYYDEEEEHNEQE